MIGHSVATAEVGFTSLWIWFSYEMGTHISPYPFGPKEPYLSTFYAGVKMLKWWAIIGNWALVTLFIYDIFADQVESKYGWSSIYANHDTEEKKIYRIVVATLKASIWVLQLYLIIAWDETF